MTQEEFEHPGDYVRAVEAFLSGENEPHPDLPIEISGESATWLRAFLVDLFRNLNAAGLIYERLAKSKELRTFLEKLDNAAENVKLSNASAPSKRFPERVSFTIDYHRVRSLGLIMLPFNNLNDYSFLTQLGTKYLAYSAFLELEDAHVHAGGKPNLDLKRYFEGQFKKLNETRSEAPSS